MNDLDLKCAYEHHTILSTGYVAIRNGVPFFPCIIIYFLLKNHLTVYYIKLLFKKLTALNSTSFFPTSHDMNKN
jgi:hypothetical protein